MATPPPEKLGPLGVFIGAWDTTIVPANPDGGDGASSKASDVYEWSPNGQFLYHTVDAMMGGERMQSMESADVGETSGAYRTYSFDADGSVNSFDARLEGKVWTLAGETQRFTGRFTESGTVLAGEWEHLADGKWSPLMRVTLRKRG